MDDVDPVVDSHTQDQRDGNQVREVERQPQQPHPFLRGLRSRSIGKDHHQRPGEHGATEARRDPARHPVEHDREAGGLGRDPSRRLDVALQKGRIEHAAVRLQPRQEPAVFRDELGPQRLGQVLRRRGRDTRPPPEPVQKCLRRPYQPVALPTPPHDPAMPTAPSGRRRRSPRATPRGPRRPPPHRRRRPRRRPRARRPPDSATTSAIDPAIPPLRCGAASASPAPPRARRPPAPTTARPAEGTAARSRRG